jgi:pre-rRNA-processing protein TSR3
MNTLIWRHRKENLNKCSLRGLESLPYLQFYTYPTHSLPSYPECILLKVGAPLLSWEVDRSFPLLLLDGTWHLTQRMEKALYDHPTLTFQGRLIPRSLPHQLQTAYPRRQTGCNHPLLGLASLEALFAAHLLLKRPTEHLLASYRWARPFLANNPILSILPSMEKSHV